jgi:hypothetical protein
MSGVSDGLLLIRGGCKESKRVLHTPGIMDDTTSGLVGYVRFRTSVLGMTLLATR